MNHRKPTDDMRRGWAEWVASRPHAVRVVAERFEPWRVYRMRSSGHLVTIYSFSEHGDAPVTLKVNVSKEFNPGIAFERTVFGVDPDDLVATPDGITA